MGEVVFEEPLGVFVKVLDGLGDLLQHILRMEQSFRQAGYRRQHHDFHFGKEIIRSFALPVFVQVAHPVAQGGVQLNDILAFIPEFVDDAS